MSFAARPGVSRTSPRSIGRDVGLHVLAHRHLRGQRLIRCNAPQGGNDRLLSGTE